ncbi:uncharacterized protein BDR25DRAFT_385205 [Lindgomyces ingoldianus]|uniref:Uncharacterized protein n=1 Tax=Lindgomyces ingoldianus TaxID=673940 RepID=A0ACB6Q832_9PLEO|nr:uncharacterized protein BDR25DRAFT_385205 [Lindgomyces ingoldianus]KAF2463005.1 hypothetical protein BDR25DRAFT_385205 [Lindgomyces ingoldianus]
MSDEEQRREYAHYMGATTSSGQQYFYPLVPYKPTDQQQLAEIPPAAPSPPIPMSPKPSSYVSLPRSYAPLPAQNEYGVSWHYSGSGPPPPVEVGASTEMVPVPAAGSVASEVYEHRRSRDRYYHCSWDYRPERAASPSPPPQPALAPVPVPTVPVLFCHTCSECGRIRSAGFHRENPIIPGKPVVPGVCRRCEKKENKKSEENDCVKKVTHIRSCTVDPPEEPCDWPSRSRSVHIQIGRNERRGRQRSRSRSSSEDIHIVSRARSHDKPRPVIRRSESHTRLGLRLIEDVIPEPPSSPRRARKGSTLRVASVSPVRNSARARVKVTHRNVSHSPPRTEYKPRSISVEERSTSAERRIASHPMAYRAVLPDQRAFFDGASTAVSHTSYPQTSSQLAGQSPPSQAQPILKPPNMSQETIHGRVASVCRSQESTMVEVGGPRVQFTPSTRAWSTKPMAGKGTAGTTTPNTAHWSNIATTGANTTNASGWSNNTTAGSGAEGWKSRERRHGGGSHSSEDHEHYHRRVRSGYRHYEPPSLPSRSLEEVHVRHAPPPLPCRASTPHPNAPTASERPPSLHSWSRAQTPFDGGLTPGPSETKDRDRDRDWDEVTVSDTTSQKSAEVEILRKWKGVDERGHPCTFVEERMTRYVPEGKIKSKEERGSWREV